MKNLISGSILAHLAQICFPPPESFARVLPLLDFKHCCKLSLLFDFKEKISKLKKMIKKPQFSTDLDLLGPNLGHQFF